MFGGIFRSTSPACVLMLTLIFCARVTPVAPSKASCPLRDGDAAGIAAGRGLPRADVGGGRAMYARAVACADGDLSAAGRQIHCHNIGFRVSDVERLRL